jgi:hypothetical protein
VVTADAFSDITAPLLIILAGLVVAGLALGLERRRTLRARSPSLGEWQRDHGHAIDDWAGTVDGIIDGSAPEAERPDEALRAAMAACPDRPLRRELGTMSRAGALACRRATKGRRPGHHHRLYTTSLDRALALIPEAVAPEGVSGGSPTGRPA